MPCCFRPGCRALPIPNGSLCSREHHKKLLVLRPRPGSRVPDIADKDLAAPDDGALQDAFIRYVEASGVPRNEFSSVDELCQIVMRQPWVLPPADKAIVLPYPSLGSLFKGRAGFLARLRASLTRPDGGKAATSGRAVHGLGGVGKTRAAVEYAWAHAGDYTALILLDAETGDKLAAGLAALVGPLRLVDAQATTDATARAEAAVAWLNANPGWFLILDNIDAEPALEAAHHLLGRLSGGHVVLTSRLARFPRGVERLDLDVLTLDDASAFLLEATATGRRLAPDDAAQARALAEELGRLALALEMAAATVEARQMSFAQYLEVWQGNRARVVGWAQPEITGYHHAVAETWRTSVDQLGEPGRHLLERLAFLAPDPVPMALLDVPVPSVAAEDGVAALDDLATYSLATRDAEGETFLVHRLVQDVTRRGLQQAGGARGRLTEALGWVNGAFTGDAGDAANWRRLDPLSPHAEAVAALADAVGITEPTLALMGRLDTLFDAKALYRRAEHYSRRALAIAEASFPPNDARVATLLNNLAELLRATNRLGEAEPLMRRALAIDEASYGKDHSEVAIRLNNLALLLQATNRLGEAEPLMRRALASDEASFSKDHPNVARDLNNLAELLRATNRRGEAEPLMRRALAIDEASLGKDHPNVASALNNLAALLHDTNRIGEAEPLMRRVIDIFEASLGKDHPNVVGALNNLAQLLQATNRLGEAEPLMRRALTVTEASLGKDHPNVAIRLNNLAQLLQATNRLGEAEPLMRRALAIFLAFERDTGHVHPHRDLVTHNYAGLLAAMGRSEADIAATIAALHRDAGLDQG
jgi:tetratricopeptide (TPR) repeat protein